MSKRNILIGLLLIAVIGGITGLYFYQQKTPDAAAFNTDFALSATELYQAFETDEAAANERYLDKTIEVKGTVKEVVQNAGSGTMTVQLEAGGLLGGVSCELSAGQSETPRTGETYTFKGICSGMLMDVVLNRCVIL